MNEILKFFVNQDRMLGRNERNLMYTLKYNLKDSRAIADNKLFAKRIFKKNKLPIAKTLGVIRKKEDIESFDWSKLPESFVLKPNKGYAGGGIIVVYGEDKLHSKEGNRVWVKQNGVKIYQSDLEKHIIDILDNKYSLGGTKDKAFFEERLKLLKEFKLLTYKGIPDVRVIVFNKIPVMAMMRLPTVASSGKANITIGAIGVGIDIGSGVTTGGVYFNKPIEIHPDTKSKIVGFRVPYWDQILEISTKAQIASGLGLAGVDIALCRDHGPTILEINARPGLGIQIANNDSLKERLERVRKLKFKSIKHSIKLAKDLFGGEIEEEIEEITGKTVIGRYVNMNVEVRKKNLTVLAKVDTGADSTSIDSSLAREFGLLNSFDEFMEYYKTQKHESKNIESYHLESILDFANYRGIARVNNGNGTSIRPRFEVTIKIGNVKKKTIVNVIGREELKFQCIIGERDLNDFLVDVEKKI